MTRLETLRLGQPDAPSLLLIHGINPVNPKAAFVAELARTRHIVAPSLPGFGASPLPADYDTIYDLVNTCLDQIDAIPADRVDVCGFGFGGWLAAELAVVGHRKLRRLVLADPVGIKLGGRTDRDIVHHFNTDPAELNRLAWHDPAARPDGVYGLGWQATISETMTDADMVALARNWDTLCLFAWRPHMFNPRLKDWLHRIRAPSLVLWGDSDRIVTPDYGKAYAAHIPNATFAAIPRAGHHPELEQPGLFVAQIDRFLS